MLKSKIVNKKLIKNLFIILITMVKSFGKEFIYDSLINTQINDF